MVNIVKKVTLSGNSTANGSIVATFTASIDGNNPEQVNLSNTNLGNVTDAEVRQRIRTDYDEFLKTVYATQDEMIAEKSAE